MSYDKNSIEAKIGECGEKIVDMFISGDYGNVVAYKPMEGKPHQIDTMIIYGWDEKNMDQLQYDVKTKPKTFKYNDTGIDKSSWDIYKALKEKNKLPTYLFFVDWFEGCCYGGEIEDLGEPDRLAFGIVFWGLNKMDVNFDLTDSQIELLKSMWVKTKAGKYLSYYESIERYFK